MSATLNLIVFLLTGLATAAGLVIGAGGALCAVLLAGWLWWRGRARKRP